MISFRVRAPHHAKRMLNANVLSIRYQATLPNLPLGNPIALRYSRAEREPIHFYTFTPCFSISYAGHFTSTVQGSMTMTASLVPKKSSKRHSLARV
jgi:hypothetical protein